MKQRLTQWLALFLLTLGTGLQAATTIYVATAFGPYKSTDSGVTWKQLFATVNNPLLSKRLNADAITVDPLDPSTVYFVRGPSGFYKSTDGGQSWSATLTLGYTLAGDSNHPQTLAIDPVKTNVIYSIAYPTSGGPAILKSTDAGATFAPTTHLPPPSDYPSQYPDGVSVAAITMDPSHSGVLYAVGEDYVFKTTDFGNTWTQIASAKTTGAQITSVYVDPSHGQTLYAVSTGACSNFICGLLKTTDGGNTWSLLSGLASINVFSVAIEPNSGAIYVDATVTGLGVAAVKSTDGGNTWAPLYDQFSDNPGSGEIVEVDPNTASTVYALPVGYNQMYQSDDGGADWSHVLFPQGCDQPGSCGGTNSATNFVVAKSAPAPPPPPDISTNGIVNGASFAPGVVPNSWVTILGTNLAAKTDDWSNSIVNGQFPITLDGVSVTIGGKPAYIYFISSGQINLLAPDVGFGSLPLTVTTAGGTSATFMVTSSQYGPAFFAWPNSQPVATRQDFSFAVKPGTFSGMTTVAAKPGDVIILWGTGFGPTDPIAPPGEAVPGDKTYSTTTLPTVTINNVPAKVYGAALTPGAGGLYQVAIQVPSSIPDGDWQVQATIGGVESPAGVLLSVHQ
jgi:uncharacterized protein (TIGR03437 family)